MGWDSATFTDKGTGRKDSMSKSGEGRCKGRFKTEKEVLKQDNDVLKQEIWSFLHNLDARGKAFAKECIYLVMVSKRKHTKRLLAKIYNPPQSKVTYIFEVSAECL